MSVIVKSEVVFDPKAGPARNNALDTMVLIEQAIKELVIKENQKRITDKTLTGDATNFHENIAAVRYHVSMDNPQSGFFNVAFNNVDTPRVLSVFFDLAPPSSYSRTKNSESVRLDLGADDFSANLIPKISEYLIKNSPMFTGYYFADERHNDDGISDDTPFISKQDILAKDVGRVDVGIPKRKKNGVKA
jgi:hypothetical protein